MSLTTRVVTWDFTDIGQAALTGTVTFAPSQFLTDPSDDLTIATAPRTYRYSGGGGSTGSGLVTTDNASIQQQGWWYVITVQWGDAPAWPAPSFTFTAFLPSGAGSIDLSQLAPLVSPAGMASYLPAAGGTLTGPLILAGDPQVPLQAATKEYVDLQGGAVDTVNGQTGTVVLTAAEVGADTAGAAAAAQAAAEAFATAAAAQSLPLAGGAMSGPIAMTSQKITGLASGTAAGDAVAAGQLPSALAPLPLATGGTGTSAASAAALLAALGGVSTAGAAFAGEVTVQDPVNVSDAATKAYVDAVAQGLSVKPSVLAATTGPLPANTYSAGVLTATGNGALAVDGESPGTGARILVKDEAAQAGNGIYVVTQAGDSGTPWILTRAADMNTGTQVPGAFAFTSDGTVNSGAGFVVTGHGTFTIGVTAITWTQFSGTGQITAGAGLMKAGNLMGLAVPVTIAHGGTGATSQGAALTALTGAQSAGAYVRSDGTSAALSPVQAADLPSLDQIPAPAANVALAGRKITGLANGTASGDAAAFGQIPAALPPSGTAGGDLSGTYPAPSVTAVHLASPLDAGQGGTGQGDLQSAMDALAGAVTAGQYLRGDGSHAVMSALQPADLTAAGAQLMTAGMTTPVRVVTAPAYTVSPVTDSVILADATAGTVTITLPSAAGIAGQMFTVKKTDATANSVYFAAQAGQTVDGAAHRNINSQFRSVTAVSDGANWQETVDFRALNMSAGVVSALGAASAGATGNLADAGHVHPSAGVVLTSQLPLALASGGTGGTDQQSAINALAGTQAPGRILRSDGTNTTLVPQLYDLLNGGNAFREPYARSVAYVNLTALNSGVALLVAVPCYAGDVVSSIAFCSGLTALTTGSNADGHLWFALYSPSAALLSQTADQGGSATWAANSKKDLALAAAQTIPSAGVYYAAVMVNAGTGGSPAVPTLRGTGGGTNATTGVFVTGMRMLAATNGSALGASAPAGPLTLNANSNIPYCVLH